MASSLLLAGLERSSIQTIILDSIQQADVDCRRELYRNIFLTGGTAKLKGKLSCKANPFPEVNIYMLKWATISMPVKRHNGPKLYSDWVLPW